MGKPCCVSPEERLLTSIFVDYWNLNAVTKLDKFPIDDLLDQLGKARYFTTLDLAAGYWQIRVAEESNEKTAFITHRGLYEFCVMPFGHTNAPAVFQRLMQVMDGLKAKDDREFVCVYIDDVLVFSCSFEEHLEHLELLFERLRLAGLEVKQVSLFTGRSGILGARAHSLWAKS